MWIRVLGCGSWLWVGVRGLDQRVRMMLAAAPERLQSAAIICLGLQGSAAPWSRQAHRVTSLSPSVPSGTQAASAC